MNLKKYGFLVTRLIQHFPLLRFLADKYRSNRRFRMKYTNEMLILSGKHKTKNDYQSVFFFTVHKCASVYVGNLLKKIASDSGITPLDFEAYFFSGGNVRTNKKNPGFNDEVFKKKGYLYGPFREYRSTIANIEDYKILLFLRDPRDVLVSFYYSVAFSHGIPSRNRKMASHLLQMRENAQNMSIDSFVVDNADLFLCRYQSYCQKLLNAENVFFSKYEEMVSDFDKWLAQIINFVGIKCSSNTKKEIICAATLPLQQEDQYRNKRQVTPGDHKRKLRIETIEKLNAKFAEILEILDYNVD
jgi:hypothetical protein